MAGYSGKSLYQKLGVKAGWTIVTRGAPTGYQTLLGDLPAGVVVDDRAGFDSAPLIHLFTRDKDALEQMLVMARNQMPQDAMVWISWPKKSSRVPSTVTEDVIRDMALPLGLVDVKVCAVDTVWSALKLVIRRELRAS